MDVNVEGYPGSSDFPNFVRYFVPPSLLQNDREAPESWRLISGNQIIDRDYPSYRQGLNPPDGGPDDEPNGGGGPNIPGGGGGGPGGPGNDPIVDFYNRYNRNPYTDVMKMITD
jgi:hypothetical protein